MPDFLHYQVTQKNPRWGEAITQGFGARVARLENGAQLGRGFTHIIAGLQFGALEVLKAVRDAGEPYVFADRAYFGGGYRSGRMRLTFGAYQQNWVTPVSAARYWGVALEPWRERGDFVMVVPPSPEVESLFGIRWDRDWMPRIRAATQRPIVISPKSDRDASPILDRLKGCHCVITWTSNVAVDALCAGVPAIVSGDSAAAPTSELLPTIEHSIESPGLPAHSRAAWFASLAHGQFTVNEIASGFAREAVMESACATT